MLYHLEMQPLEDEWIHDLNQLHFVSMCQPCSWGSLFVDFFSSMIFVSLEMTRVNSTSCSFMDVMFVIITNIVTQKEKLRKLECFNESSSLEIPIGGSKHVGARIAIDNKVGRLLPKVFWYWGAFFSTMRTLAFYP